MHTPTPNGLSSSAILPDFVSPRPGSPSSPLAPVAPIFEDTYRTSHNRSHTMGIFSRTRDIIAANVTDLLDKSARPGKADPHDHHGNGGDAGRSPRLCCPHHCRQERTGVDISTKLDHPCRPTGPTRHSSRCRRDRDDLAKAALLVERKKAVDMKPNN
jgi:hypothetical protein